MISNEESLFYLFSYDIAGKEDPHGLRVRLNYFLKKSSCIHLLRSIWLVKQVIIDSNKFKYLLKELKLYSFPYIITKWEGTQSITVKKESKDEDIQLGIVIHGPEVIDLGIVNTFVDALKKRNTRFICQLGGTMGKIAVIDSELEEIIPISSTLKPSECVDFFLLRNVDGILILNHARTRESGIEFGFQVFSKSKLAPFYHDIPIIQLDLMNTPDAFCIFWNAEESELLEWLIREFPMDKLNPRTIKTSKIPKIEEYNGKIIRRVSPVEIGDWILVSGLVIGEIVDDEVVITTIKGLIIEEETRGIKIIPHGLEKLGKFDLGKSRITTLKTLRRTDPRTRGSKTFSSPKKATMIKKAESLLPLIQEVDTVISIGDDTTYLLYDFLSRFPKKHLIGIVDMDSEFHQNVELTDLYVNLPKRFEIIQVEQGFDDIVGSFIQEKIFKKKRFFKYSNFNKFRKQIEDIITPWQLKIIN